MKKFIINRLCNSRDLKGWNNYFLNQLPPMTNGILHTHTVFWQSYYSLGYFTFEQAGLIWKKVKSRTSTQDLCNILISWLFDYCQSNLIQPYPVNHEAD